MAKYNVSKREAAKHGIERVRIGGGGGGGGSKRSKFKSGKYTTSDTLKSLQGQLLSNLKPGEKELGTEKQLDNILTGRDLGIQHQKERPVEMGFITGRGKQITERAALQAQPLQQQLARLQARRQSAADVLNTSLGFENQRLNRAQQAYSQAQQFALQRDQMRNQRDMQRQQMKLQREQFDFTKRKYNTAQARRGTGRVTPSWTGNWGGGSFKI